VFRIAASVANKGGTTIHGPTAVPYSSVVSIIQAAFKKWTTAQVTACKAN
jgi:hypothetical protein